MSRNPDDAFVVGAWFTMNLGFDTSKFCVVEKIGNRLHLTTHSWCSDNGIWMTKEDMENELHNAVFIGQGRKRKLWRYLPFNYLIMPYTQPKP